MQKIKVHKGALCILFPWFPPNESLAYRTVSIPGNDTGTVHRVCSDFTKYYVYSCVRVSMHFYYMCRFTNHPYSQHTEPSSQASSSSPPVSNHWGPLIWLHPYNLVFQDCYITGIIQYVTFWGWLLSLSIIPLRFF